MAKKDIVRIGLLGETKIEKAKQDRDDLERILEAILKDVSLEDFAGQFANPASMAIEYFLLQRGYRTCQRMSLLYNPHRLDVPTLYTIEINRPAFSIYGSLKTPPFYKGLARWIVAQSTNKHRVPTLETLWSALEVGVQGIAYANEFPPAVARDLYLKFGLDKRSKILDPCAGWGGRMIGASIVSDYYYGFEPSTKTARGLRRLAKDLGEKYSPGFNGQILCKPFEDANLPDNYFDFAFTSPPYYDAERYSDEPTQSYKRYTTFKRWCRGFYFPLIDKTMAALKPNAVFVLNIGSRRYPLNKTLHSYCEKQGYGVTRLSKQFLSGKGGLGKSGEGETFYAISKL